MIHDVSLSLSSFFARELPGLGGESAIHFDDSAAPGTTGLKLSLQRINLSSHQRNLLEPRRDRGDSGSAGSFGLDFTYRVSALAEGRLAAQGMLGQALEAVLMTAIIPEADLAEEQNSRMKLSQLRLALAENPGTITPLVSDTAGFTLMVSAHYVEVGDREQASAL